jgi:hypothetical protein
MKLKELLKVINSIQNVQILLYEGIGSQEILFEGMASDVPWTYADMQLDNSGDGESTFAFVNEKGNAIIGIYVKED